MKNWDDLEQDYPNATNYWNRYALLALSIQHVQIRRMDVKMEAKAVQGAGLFLDAVGKNQQEIAILKMQFTLRAIEGNAGALFGTVRNNVQLNLSSIDGYIYGKQSGTLFGLVARAQDNPIRVNMVDSRYCVIGNVQDTCASHPLYRKQAENSE